MKKRLLLFAGILFALGCKKEAAAPPLPDIVINTPSANQHYVMGDTVRITGTVMHTIEMVEVGVHMTDLTTKSEFFHNHFSADNKTYYEFNSKYGVDNNTKTSLKVEVEVTDKDGNTGTKELTITLN
jgi:hypothetical protein